MMYIASTIAENLAVGTDNLYTNLENHLLME